jgi:AraC-like DNA-binding protein
MKNLITTDKFFIAALSDTFEALPHQHPIMEIYAALDGIGHISVGGELLEGQTIAIGPETMHAISDIGKKGLVIFIDVLSTDAGFSLKDSILRDNPFAVINSVEIKEAVSVLRDDETEQAVHLAAESILRVLNTGSAVRPFSESVMNAICFISQEKELFDMQTLASRIHLSKSRLAHVFSEETGITLKSYLQFKRIESAFRQMVEGETITDAAYDAGFSSPSHIAASSRKLTGMQLKKLLNI